MTSNPAPRTDMLVQSDVDKVAAAVEKIDTSITWPGGRVGEIELALIDAVFSMRANYGNSPDTGVRKWVSAYADAVERPCDDLTRLVEREELLFRQTRQTVPGGMTKARAITTAASRLVDAGFKTSADITVADVEQLKKAKKAYVGVKGLGYVTFEYFLMLLGRPGIKADRHIIAFVSQALGGKGVDYTTAHALLMRVAEDRGVPAHELDHQVWRSQRSR